MQPTLTPEQIAILNLLCSSQEDNIKLAEQLAISQNMDLVDFLKSINYDKLGLATPQDFMCKTLTLTDENADYWSGYLPRSVTTMHVRNYSKPELPIYLPTKLKILICYDNQLVSLPNNLPASLMYLNCSDNRISTLPDDLLNRKIMINYEDNPIKRIN
jgi:Leucine-rich repeat (LRR) protein